MKIITALDNQIINERLQKYEEYKVLSTDISYQEGILEVLEKYKDIDIIVINKEIQGNMHIRDLIEDIKVINDNVRIILAIKKGDDINEGNIKNIECFFYEKLTLEKIITAIKKENKREKNYELITNNEVDKKENKKIYNLKKEIIAKVKNNSFKLLNLFYQNKKKHFNNKIISIVGSGGIGKSIFCANLARIINKKVLILDFDILNNSLHTLFGVNKKEKKNEKLILKINKNIDLLSGINFIKENEKYITKEKIKEIFEKIREEYDYIIIDTSCECFFDYTKNILENSDISIFLVEGNLIEIKKARKLLNIYLKNWRINKNKIKIVINKMNSTSICEEIIKELFSECSFLGKINFNKNYNYLINKNMKYIDLNNKIKKEYLKIINKIN